ncbi:hypothetical protein [Bacillus manliponensis]|uniref:hypothetical protein n=1 Tax=Bacillus manliponensis TaxID=574376 RepID=UPI00351116AE
MNFSECKLPKRLKDYFGLSNEFSGVLNEVKLKHISDVFVEYSTLYSIEDGAFSQIVLECLRRSQDDDKFGFHLRYQLKDKKDEFVVEGSYSGLGQEDNGLNDFLRYGLVGFGLLGYNTYDEMKDASVNVMQKLTEKDATILLSNFLMSWQSVLQNSNDSMQAYLSLRKFITDHCVQKEEKQTESSKRDRKRQYRRRHPRIRRKK